MDYLYFNGFMSVFIFYFHYYDNNLCILGNYCTYDCLLPRSCCQYVVGYIEVPICVPHCSQYEGVFPVIETAAF